ncbi:MAG: ribonuclease HII [Proteobacteria bacterium]|nr:ribonuclease HII [Pseudomonadota bacterium]NCA27788.1 ribonuclease HII [Pseudomonadota bacterium]
MQPSFLIENNFDTTLICGIDEAGRGPLAGPVVASCFLMNKNIILDKINDSKKLSKKTRLTIYESLILQSKFGIGVVDQEVIDKINILEATKLAMKMAYQDFCRKHNIYPQILLVDGNFMPFNICDQIKKIVPVIKGDQKSYTIASASIIAKEYRDKIMLKYDHDFPQYGFNKHFGYGTKFHLENIKKNGICKIHRRSFEPIKSMLYASN